MNKFCTFAIMLLGFEQFKKSYKTAFKMSILGDDELGMKSVVTSDFLAINKFNLNKIMFCHSKLFSVLIEKGVPLGQRAMDFTMFNVGSVFIEKAPKKTLTSLLMCSGLVQLYASRYSCDISLLKKIINDSNVSFIFIYLSENLIGDMEAGIIKMCIISNLPIT